MSKGFAAHGNCSIQSNKQRTIRGTRGVVQAAQGESATAGVATEEEEYEDDEEYSEEEQRRDMAAIRNVLKALRTKRDMPFNEVKLTIMIEDPRLAEQREKYGIEDDSGVSREELAAALVDVNEGRVPDDAYVLRELTKEMLNWPNLDEELPSRSAPTQSPYFKTTDIGVDRRVMSDRMAWDAIPELDELQEKEKDIGEGNPVVGYGLLYGISGIPIIIGAVVVGILFLNSFK
ncbi:Thylakoid protein assisting PS1 assembly with Ycf3 [Klebsormidium nitens]|uniref:Thylakoid protein assisting PS1 assembly with Ycf3 n=1 Tax=Klebsormidium nitens TaxID=105231 RepID=A0A1Y1HXT4_KLENI|nr:Thylakoid protein assisting PS1 assembly with Ycf3 [Klebsormidium nitens]|eukprot:GAQ83480.1 Thylakoid protein assisting PS1 assembly with Ycf3 [Klebsormidium nitens]